MTRVLVTGSDGMVGSRLVKFLKNNDCTVYEFGEDKDIRSRQDWAMYEGLDFDYIVHLAALAGVRPSFDDPELYYDNNVNGTREMLAFSEGNSARILYASSSNAYEWWGNPYATTKKMNEIQCEDYPAIGMRFHTIWPGRDDMLFKKLQRNDVTYINNNHYRDFVHVDDIMQAIWILMNKFVDVGQKVVDIGTGHVVPVREVAKVMGYKGDYVDENPNGERESTKADIEPLLRLGYTPNWNILDYENSPV
jgi:UDP-glucuronate 4-epimerase